MPVLNWKSVLPTLVINNFSKYNYVPDPAWQNTEAQTFNYYSLWHIARTVIKLKQMKPINILLIVSFFFLPKLNGQIVIDGDGDIGIGTNSPSSDIQINSDNTRFTFTTTSNKILVFPYYGSTPVIEPSSNNIGYLGHNYYWNKVRTKTIYRDHEYSLSDIKYKENIKQLNNSLNILEQLNPVSYDFKEEMYNDIVDEKIKSEMKSKRKGQFGLIAQEVKQVLPEIVEFDSVNNDLLISYTQLIPHLISAIQDQQIQIESLSEQLNNKKSGSLKSGVASLEITGQLNQNQPNPFSESTEIIYQVPDETESAQIYIYNMQGSQVKSYDINQYGSASLMINGYELTPGMYFYTLVADGKEIDTKKMILTD